MREKNVPTRTGVPDGSGRKVTKAVTINAPVAEVFSFWRKLDNLPKFMRHLESVTDLGGGRSHWIVKGPAGKPVEWYAEIIEERENEMISWRSLPGADLENAGSVWFQPVNGGSATELKVSMKYAPPAGVVGGLIAKIFGRDPGGELDEDLYILKAWLETGRLPQGKRDKTVVRTIE